MNVNESETPFGCIIIHGNNCAPKVAPGNGAVTHGHGMNRTATATNAEAPRLQPEGHRKVVVTSPLTRVLVTE